VFKLKKSIDANKIKKPSSKRGESKNIARQIPALFKTDASRQFFLNLPIKVGLFLDNEGGGIGSHFPGHSLGLR